MSAGNHADYVNRDSLNPYYTGSYSMRAMKEAIVYTTTVLILIILEVTL